MSAVAGTVVHEASRWPMLRVSLLVETLRARPRLVFWSATLLQAMLWFTVPALVYRAPPGDLPLLVAIGHQWQLGSVLGPPLAAWLAELAFDLSGHSRLGLYLLSQLCVVLTYWAVFALGRAIVGSRHAAMAVMLMSGMAAFWLPTVEFGPQVLMAPLTALALLHCWRAVTQGRRTQWIALGILLGLLVLTSYAGLILVGLFGLFTALNARARAVLATLGPWLAVAVAALVALPHLVWMGREHVRILPPEADFLATLRSQEHLSHWFWLVGATVASQTGLLALVAVAGVAVDRRKPAPAFERGPVDPLARAFVYFFALMPAFVCSVISVLMGAWLPVGGVASLVVLWGLAVVVAAGDLIRLHRQRVLALAWAALLAIPPAATLLAYVLLPWTIGIGPRTDRPAAAIGKFFTETFERRTGQPLAVVAGDVSLAALVAMSSRDRPGLLVPDRPELSTVAADAVRQKGAVVVWPVDRTSREPPAAITARFPDLVPEVPQAFERPIQGRLPLYRIGWAVIRPGGEPSSNKH
jgi:4-amino-4-deoxy-L-arabinose transferase-like glycosyltransferase